MLRMRNQGGFGLLALLMVALGAIVASAPAEGGEAREYVVVYEDGVSAADGRAAVEAAGGTVLSDNAAIGVATVRSSDAGFVAQAAAQDGLEGAAANEAIGQAPREHERAPAGHRAGAGHAVRQAREQAAQGEGRQGRAAGRPAVGHGDDRRHGDRLPRPAAGLARRARRRDRHRHRRVAPGHRAELRPQAQPQLHDRRPGRRRARAPTTRTATAPIRPTSTRAATARTWRARSARRSTTSASPAWRRRSSLVNLRAGQDSGYFFLGPTLDALTYAGDNGIDVVNMSFYIDPWLYNCAANPADNPPGAGAAAAGHRGDAARARPTRATAA